MFPKVLAFAVLGLSLANDQINNSKRSINALGFPNWNSALGHPWNSISYPWHPNFHDKFGPLHNFPAVYPVKVEHYDSRPSDVAAAAAAAKEAAAAAALARQQVKAAREQVAIQERVAAAKEAAAQEAIQRSEALAAAAQKSSASDASAAPVHVGGHFVSTPWSNPKAVFRHWS